MRVLIDATAGAAGLRLFGMALLERLLHALVRSGQPLSEVRVELPAGAPTPWLPASLLAALPLRWSRSDAPLARRLADALRAAGAGPWLALSADSVVDLRLIRHFQQARGNLVYLGGEGAERAALLRLEARPPGFPEGAPDADLCALAERALRSGAADAFREADFEGYIVNLRRDLPPYLFRVPDAASLARAERFLFWSNYKGSTDFMTRYAYPPLVWRLLRPLARWRVHPNWVTGASAVATFAAVPCFASCAWLPGLALAYGMSVLDSVDGKLARLTFRSSKLGDVLDHGLDIVHPPLWYTAWAWCLGGGDPASAPFRASLWMLGFYAADRLAALLFKLRTGVSIHGFTKLDERVRTFVSRRNVNLVIFTAALAIDALVSGARAALLTFYFIVAWQAAGLLWHAERVVRFWNARGAPGSYA